MASHTPSLSSATARSRASASRDPMADWSIGEKIGKGSFATVYSGKHKVSFPASFNQACLQIPYSRLRPSSYGQRWF